MTAIREGRPADFPALRAIQRSALAEPWPELLETATRGPPALYVLTDQEPLGYAIVLGDGVAYAPELAVRPDMQDQGYGSELLGWLCDQLPSAGYEELRVTAQASDERVRRFYDRHGFECIERLDDHFESGDGLLLCRPFDGD
jgi:ribosomal-protein-alanine N-acetyltransferase